MSAHHGHGDPRHSGRGADVLGVVPQGAVVVTDQAGGVGPGRVDEGVRTLSVHRGNQVLTQLNATHLEGGRAVATFENDRHGFMKKLQERIYSLPDQVLDESVCILSISSGDQSLMELDTGHCLEGDDEWNSSIGGRKQKLKRGGSDGAAKAC